MFNINLLIKANTISAQYREYYIDNLPESAYFYKITNNELVKLIRPEYVSRILALRRLVYDDILNNIDHETRSLQDYIKKIENKL